MWEFHEGNVGGLGGQFEPEGTAAQLRITGVGLQFKQPVQFKTTGVRLQ